MGLPFWQPVNTLISISWKAQVSDSKGNGPPNSSYPKTFRNTRLSFFSSDFMIVRMVIISCVKGHFDQSCTDGWRNKNFLFFSISKITFVPTTYHYYFLWICWISFWFLGPCQMVDDNLNKWGIVSNPHRFFLKKRLLPVIYQDMRNSSSTFHALQAHHYRLNRTRPLLFAVFCLE